MKKKTSTRDAGRNRSVIGAIAFGTLGAAVVLVPKVRQAVTQAAGAAFDTLQEKYQASRQPAAESHRPPKTTIRKKKPPKTKVRKVKDAAPSSPTAASVGAGEKGTKPAAQTKSPEKTQKKSLKTPKKSTDPGHVNPNRQKVVRRVGKSESWKGQYVYELECLECGHHYGANGPRIESGEGRQCPKCQGGPPGQPI